MKTKHLFTAIAVYTLCILGTQEATAQKVYKYSEGVIILDCSSDSGFPKNAATTESGKKTIDPSQSNTDNSETGPINQTVYVKLQVANQDETSTMTWQNAYTACTSKNATNGESGWRLPTQRELMLIWIFRSAFESFTPTFTTFKTGQYWSATRNNNGCCYTHFGNNDGNADGYSPNNGGANSTFNVRCVREIVDSQ